MEADPPQPEALSPLYENSPERPLDGSIISSDWPDLEARLDTQGAIAVSVTPINLDQTSATIDFLVALDTHSVNLSMDLATLATLATDQGLTVLGASWDGGVGGHHVSGTLSFPSSINGHPLREGASQFVLVIRDLDAAERSFVWSK